MRESEEIEMQIRQISKKCLYRTTEFALEEMILLYQSKKHIEKWCNIKKSGYIESLIISYPLELFLLLEQGSSYIIIDGNERTKSIIDFINGDLKLTVKRVNKLDGKSYNELMLSRQRNFMRKSLRVIVLNEDTDSETLYHIYHSLNDKL